MLRYDKTKFEEKRVFNYILGILASLLNDIVLLGSLIGFTVIVLNIPYNHVMHDFISQKWLLFVVLVLAVIAILTSPWRKFKRRAIKYYRSLSDELDFDEWKETLLRKHPRAEISNKDSYIDIFEGSNYQISVCKENNDLSEIKTLRKYHLVLVYNDSELDESIFDLNTLRKRIIVYCPKDRFTYSITNDEYLKLRKLIMNFGFEIFVSRYRGFKEIKVKHLPMLLVNWLFQMF